jgi:cold shock CspA family protein
MDESYDATQLNDATQSNDTVAQSNSNVINHASQRDPKILETKTGTIITICGTQGYGFIWDDDGRAYFFHRIGLISPPNFDDLREGQQVEFIPVKSGKGKPKAIGVVVV